MQQQAQAPQVVREPFAEPVLEQLAEPVLELSRVPVPLFRQPQAQPPMPVALPVVHQMMLQPAQSHWKERCL